MSKSKRICQGCGKANNSLYPVCNQCRAKGCLHNNTHYDTNLCVVCDQCGTVVDDRRKKIRSVGAKAHWQMHQMRIS